MPSPRTPNRHSERKAEFWGEEWCLNTIVFDNNLMEVRKRIEVNREEGKLLKDKMDVLKKISVGQMFRLGSILSKAVIKLQKNIDNKK